MKILKITIFSMILIALLSYQNYTFCKDYQFYELSFMKSENRADRPVQIEFNYEISESLKKSLYSIDLFNKEEQAFLDKGFQEKEYKVCEEILNKVNYLQQKNGSYLVADSYFSYNYSRPIHLSKSKVCIFYDYLIMQKGRSIKNSHGVSGGASFLQIFEKENNKWILKKSQILQYY